MSKFTPDFSFERQCCGPVCGVDEAGRGPLAGPVVAAAVILTPARIPEGLNDSKALSSKQRELLLNAIEKNAKIGIGIAEPEEIDRINILQASLIAMRRAVLALPTLPDMALIDGNKLPQLPCNAQAFVKGDSRSLSIAAASIVAKVTRDRLMVEADARYPGYGLAGHKGYPTKAHIQSVQTLGPSPIHRFSFKPMRLVIEE
ncbi:MAG: ribonuclease HII [Hellea sp.]